MISWTRNGGGALAYSVVHVRDQRNEKKGCFLRLNAILENRNYGSKCDYFQEKGLFIRKLRSYISNVPKKSCLGLKSDAKIV